MHAYNLRGGTGWSANFGLFDSTVTVLAACHAVVGR